MSGVVIGRTTNVSGMNISHSVINTGSGSITIGGSARGMVIRTGQDTQVTYSRGGSVALRIGLPSSLLMDLSVKSKQGEVRIAGKFDNEHKDGRGVSVLAGSGSIECQGICAIGQIELRTSSGDVAAEAVDGSLKVVSEHGKIRLTGNRGAIQVEGNMTGVIADANEGDITVETRMGNVEITRQSHGKIDVKTGMGDIHLKALAPTATEGNIETRMGEVHRDTPVRANPHRPDPSAHRRRDTRW